MGIAFTLVTDHDLLLMRVTERPRAEDLAVRQQEASVLHAMSRFSRALLDLRDQTGSDLDGAAVRSILLRCDRQTGQIGPHAVLPMAIVATPGSIGQGIARMFLGHAHGLPHLSLELFETPEEAGSWLGMTPGWEKVLLTQR
ncbi:hypothetical protein [Mesobacterium pallidum]|uniref:hypothetical protein n=1 Tax=Mesobacterium pallidum TaxID=2872037 RepID=UPI001EE17D9B|nr:hypothetical protein [Mesobacterium pallidum]